MEKYYNWKDLSVNFRVYSVWTLSSIMDSTFLAAWVALQWIVNEYVIKNLGLRGVDYWMLLIFQVIFAISTLIPIIIYIYVDIRVMITRAQFIIHAEILKATKNAQNIN